MLEQLKQRVYKANLDLPKYGLVLLTWGNVSGIDRDTNLVVIKPSGVPYNDMTVDDMVVVNLSGNIVEGKLKPSSDLLTHLEIYKNFTHVNGIVHTHSTWCTSWAQAVKPIKAYGTTHADYFYGDIPITRMMTDQEIEGSYELNTGKVIIEAFADKDPREYPGVIVANHGPFCWGESPEKAVEHAVVMEEVARLAYNTETLNATISPISNSLLNKHFLRKHGSNAYYGQ